MTHSKDWFAIWRVSNPATAYQPVFTLQYVKVREGDLSATPRELIMSHIQDILQQYHAACQGVTSITDNN